MSWTFLRVSPPGWPASSLRIASRRPRTSSEGVLGFVLKKFMALVGPRERERLVSSATKGLFALARSLARSTEQVAYGETDGSQVRTGGYSYRRWIERLVGRARISVESVSRVGSRGRKQAQGVSSRPGPSSHTKAKTENVDVDVECLACNVVSLACLLHPPRRRRPRTTRTTATARMARTTTRTT